MYSTPPPFLPLSSPIPPTVLVFHLIQRSWNIYCLNWLNLRPDPQQREQRGPMTKQKHLKMMSDLSVHVVNKHCRRQSFIGVLCS